MPNSTLRTLTPGSAVVSSDILAMRQGADTVDKSVTAAQLRTFINTIVIDTEKNILALSPATNRIGWASDIRQLLFSDGTNWWSLSGYLDKNLQNPDEGWIQGSNREGYGGAYITDKSINHCSIGANANTVAGGIRYSATGLNGGPVLQAYYNGTWNNLVSGLNLQEVNAILEQTPVGYTQRLAVFSGNSDFLGLNAIPLIQAYKISMGAFPFLNKIAGGTLNAKATGQTVAGSTSGTAFFFQAADGQNLKEITIDLTALLGTASYTFPVAFTKTPQILTTNGPAAGIVTSLSTTAVTVTGATTTGLIFLKGY